MKLENIFNDHSKDSIPTFGGQCFCREINALTLVINNDSSTSDRASILNEAKKILKERSEKLFSDAECN